MPSERFHLIGGAALPGADRWAPQNVRGLPIALPEGVEPALVDELPFHFVEGAHPLHVVHIVTLMSGNAQVDAG
ncbi:hypothetical protein V2W30_01190 [Streptomyces sp. Q6]|uniref:Uncharacterized protein n=1 Tax=Streptomyces citrinus TaxID=3118173 RepID=A0ACD5A4Z3_9ACTN